MTRIQFATIFVLLASIFMLTPFAASAQIVSGNLEVTLEGGGPALFTENNIAPGYSESRTVTVTNNGTETEDIITSTANEIEGGLEDELRLTITSPLPSSPHFTGTFQTFFGPDPIDLGELAGGATRVYTFTVSLDDTVGNNYQNTTMGFDLVIGFEGGTTVTTGGNGGGGGNNNNQTQRLVPAGIVEGESTSTTPTFTDTFVRPVAEFLRGRVLGESTSTDDIATSSISEINDINGVEGVTRSSSPAKVLWGEENCVMWWLLLLTLIFFGWSVYDDKYRNSGAAFHEIFVRNALFSAIYVTAVILFHVFALLAIFWWVLALAWAGMVAFDYRMHRPMMTTRELMNRVVYYGAAGLFFVFTSLIFGFPCAWWPFFLMICGAALTYFFDLYEG